MDVYYVYVFLGFYFYSICKLKVCIKIEKVISYVSFICFFKLVCDMYIFYFMNYKLYVIKWLGINLLLEELFF